MLKRKIIEVEKKFKIFFFIFGATISIILILTVLQTPFSTHNVIVDTVLIGYILIGVGAARLVFLDLPIVIIFLRQLYEI